MAAMSIVFCASWDCVKTKNKHLNLLTEILNFFFKSSYSQVACEINYVKNLMWLSFENEIYHFLKTLLSHKMVSSLFL